MSTETDKKKWKFHFIDLKRNRPINQLRNDLVGYIEKTDPLISFVTMDTQHVNSITFFYKNTNAYII